ncbi:lipocalin family protein [Arenimonas alkanexedens]
MKTLPALALLMALSAPAAAEPAQPLQAVPELDLQRYSGTWYEIARLPMYFERRCVSDVTATYVPLESGRVEVRNACLRDDGVRMQSKGMARLSGTEPAKLEVRFAPSWLSFLPMVWSDYWVIALDEDYQWALVGEPDRKYLWILSRDSELDAATFDMLKAKARELGYSLDELIVVVPPRAD